ncbi:MAG TPA: metal-dependent hydrolase [Actinomycetota bacterium]|jgi:L-ascorbate metabolism protein UlaG (beta-lactamase superfamily)|nr:metal-dependent hydrolase [Actinomycetota bacterium]
MDLKGTEVTWLGHGTFKFRTSEGKVVLVDPWVMNNPGCPDAEKNPEQIDLVLITHAHFDHIGDAVELGRKLEPQTFAIFETANWLGSKEVPNVTGMNLGGTVVSEGVSFTMVQAAHSCGILDDGQIIYGGVAAGYIIRFPGGLRVYYAGDTTVFGDMKIIAELYEPDISILPIGDFYTMGPREAAYAVKLLGAKTVIPMHYGTFPVLTGTPDELMGLVGAATEVVAANPGETLS